MPAKVATHVFVTLCVAFGVLVPFYALPSHGMNGADESYLALSSMFYRESPMAPLSFYIGWLAMQCFGDTLITLRILQFVMHLLAISIGILYFYRSTRALRMSAFLFMLLSITSQMWAMNLYGWDTGSYPFAMLCLVATLAYYRKASQSRAAAVGVCAALMILSRIPLAAILPVLLVLPAICRRGNKKEMLADIATIAVALAFVLIVFVFIIYGGVKGLVDAWNRDNIITGHLGENMAYIHHRLHVTRNMVSVQPLIGLLAAVGAIVSVRVKKFKAAVIIIFVLTMMNAIVSLKNILGFPLMFAIYTPVTFAFCLYPLYRRLCGNETVKSEPVAWIVLAFAIVQSIGSDSFLERFLVLPTLPVAMTICYTRFRCYLRPFAAYLFVAALTIYVHDAYGNSRYYVVPGEALSPRLKGIKVSPEFYKKEMEVKELSDSLSAAGVPFTFMGEYKYVDAYLFSPKSMYKLHHFHTFEVSRDIEMLDSTIGSPRIEAIVAESWVYPGEEEQHFLDYLRENGYILVDTVGNRRLFVRK